MDTEMKNGNRAQPAPKSAHNQAAAGFGQCAAVMAFGPVRKTAMTESTNTTQVISIQAKFDDDMRRAFQSAGPDDVAAARKLATSKEVVSQEIITANVAAVIFQQHNGANRDLSVAKAREYQHAMERGEWKETHQGIAFDEEGKLIDGQHRIAALALAGKQMKLVVYRGANRKIIDAIDQSKPRKAHEALKLAGIDDSQEKERVARATMEYAAKVVGQAVKPTVIQIEQYVSHNDEHLTEAIRVAKQSSQNIAEPCLTETQAAQIAHLMQLGQWPRHLIPAFLTTLQAGVEQRENGVIVPTAKLMLAARRSERKTDRMSRDEQIATILKAAQHWAKGESVARFKPVRGRDKLVDFHVTDDIVVGTAVPAAA